MEQWGQVGAGGGGGAPLGARSPLPAAPSGQRADAGERGAVPGGSGDVTVLSTNSKPAAGRWRPMGSEVGP